jgi:hypothetical protein
MISDRVSQLRRWGTSIAYQLSGLGDEPTLGTSAECSIRLDDPSGQVSRVHARFARTDAGWAIRDLGSTNGILLDGASHKDCVLEPGTELGFGDVILIAESEQLIALQNFLSRLLGWARDRRPEIDRALRSVRLAATHRAPLVLMGEGDLAPIARALHDRVRGADRPFLLCDPRRRLHDETVRSVASRSDVSDALREATGGSVCFRRNRLPPGTIATVDESLRGPRSRVQVIMCAKPVQGSVESLLVDPVIIPPLRDRASELDRIISEYAEDAADSLRVARRELTEEELDWVRRFAASSLPQIEKGTRRVVAFRASRNLSGAAARLGMAPVSLSRWIGRRDVIE